jgi:hypothetical protein
LKGNWTAVDAAKKRPANIYPEPVERAELRALLRQRNEALAADTRSDTERLLGTPPPGKSALDEKRALPDRPRDFLKIEPTKCQGVTVAGILKSRERRSRPKGKLRKTG